MANKILIIGLVLMLLSCDSCNHTARWRSIKVKTIPFHIKGDIVINELNIRLKKIPKGTFQMGKTFIKKKAQPQLHEVEITYPFWMDCYEIGQGTYRKILGEKKDTQDDSLPATLVSWASANSFCDSLNRLYGSYLPEGYEFRLPTEAEWEYACRAGTSSDFNISENKQEFAWAVKNSGATVHASGLFQANAWGLYDMHGNVGEWCLDSYELEYDTSIKVNPFVENLEHYDKVTRGGGYLAKLEKASSFARFGWYSFTTSPGYGFRVVIGPKVVLLNK